MDLVFISMYAYSSFSEHDYHDYFWLKRSSYNKIKKNIPEEIYCEELKVMGEIYVDDEPITESELANEIPCEQNGNCLRNYLEDLYKAVNIDFNKEQYGINKFFDDIDMYETVIVRVPKSKVKDLINYADSLKRNRR